VKKHVNVVGAVIVKNGKVLCAQRGPDGDLPFKWEFPGGKVEPGESPRDALEREIHEELRCVVTVGDHVETTTYEYDFATVTLSTFYCKLLKTIPQLTEHSELRWCNPRSMSQLDWAPADIPAVAIVCQVLAS
jgi:8-oxo-dGTP diphosphatase